MLRKIKQHLKISTLNELCTLDWSRTCRSLLPKPQFLQQFPQTLKTSFYCIHVYRIIMRRKVNKYFEQLEKNWREGKGKILFCFCILPESIFNRSNSLTVWCFIVVGLSCERRCVTKPLTKFLTVGTAIKLSEIFKFKKLTAQNITKRYIKQSKYKRKHRWTNLKKFETSCNCGFWQLVSLTAFQISFLLLVGDVFVWQDAVFVSFTGNFTSFTA